MYLEALAWLEASGLGHVARHSGALFMAANVLHVLGAALVLGGIAVFDLQLILVRGEAAAQTGRIAIPLAALGLALQIPTGLTLLAVEATKLGRNPAFYGKLGFIALGLVNLAWFHLRFSAAMREGVVPAAARPLAYISLMAWSLTLVAGRMIAYL